ncbi:hypothetical protein E4U54_002054 [Claviceps lovelessii]|nr:hypothetical protein E4U54_002054 [Claviceps lovelessii]
MKLGVPGRPVILLPMVLALVAFILSMLARYAGHEQGFMEEYAVLRLDTSKLGHDILGKVSEENKTGGEKKKNAHGFGGDALEKLSELTDGVKGKINEAVGHIVDKVVKKIGIKEWYSLHITNWCEGDWSPNSTVVDAGLNITNCSSFITDGRFDLRKIVDKEIQAGPFKINPASITWPDTIQKKLDTLARALLALLNAYAVCAGLSGLAFVCSIVAFWKPDLRRIVLMNLVVSAPGFLVLFISSATVTASANFAVAAVNDLGGVVGLSATAGTKFYTLTWVATGFMGFVSLFWVGKYLAMRKETKRRGFNEK